MDKPPVINPVEKQRLRDTIADQVRRFLDSGGQVTVLETPRGEQYPLRGSAWHSSINSYSVSVQD